jgi:hypothetical protein
MLPVKGLRGLVVFVLPICAAGFGRAEDCRYGHGNADVRAMAPIEGCPGWGCVLIDKQERWARKVPWVVQDHWLEPSRVFIPELPIEGSLDSCLVYWDVYVPVAAQAVWHVRYAGELHRQNGVWRIRYYAMATLRSVPA